MLITRPTNHLGQPVNEAHPLHRFTDAEVARARELRAAGATARAIAAVIGCHHTTALRWATERARRPAVAVRVVRTKTPLATNHQQQREEGAVSPPHTVALTDAEVEALRKLHGGIA